MITVKDLSMRYGSTIALDNVSFHIPQGGIVGLLGPNGAGKTTLMRTITTYLTPTSGEVTVGGYNTLTNPIPIRKMIGYLPETPPLYTDMLVSDYLSFVAQARGLTKETKKRRINLLVDMCDIRYVYKKTIIELSKGYRQRVGLAQALIHDPEILILDEPTIGLDPLQVIDIRNLIKNLSAQKTVIFSTHILQEITSLSDRVIILNNGSLIADGPKSRLEIEAMETKQSSLVVRADAEDVSNALDAVEGITSCNLIETADDGFSRFEIQSAFDMDISEAIDSLIKSNGWVLKSYHDQPIGFEEVFISLLKKIGKTEKKQP
ncbi:MAG: ABC transporter ATP-binding protein [Thermodesulfobacteriota bacterium]